ncbi:ribonuclease T [Salinisphaera aquimarina]|uniref:Ribonuclease T n=1 Tax=Salinisphaera aquimarina TaxID=2094031 RepID=A0ABV7EM65_9GAMM
MTDTDTPQDAPAALANRFRGFLPVVIDVETGGFNSATDALLEIAAVTVDFDDTGDLEIRESIAYHVKPFEGANMEPASLEVNGIDPHHPLRPAISEHDALSRIFKMVRATVKDTGCKRAVLVGHNAHFDLGFLNAAIARTGIKRSPFHPFSCFDTATLGGVAFGQTVLRRAATAAGMDWDNDAAHSARYDTEQTARLFCTIVNRFRPVYEAVPPEPQS